MNIDFDVHLFLVYLLRISLAFGAGFLMGLERKVRQQVVGMRTLILISVSSALFGIISVHMGYLGPGGDSTRIAAQVVSGVGFLGGGAIMRQGLNIKGLTSAAIIWTAAAVGLSLGGGLYLPAVLVVIVALFSLILLEKFEEKHFPAGRLKSLHLVFDDDSVDLQKVKSTISKSGFIVADFNMSRILAEKQIILHYSVKAPRCDDFSDLIKGLKEIGDLAEFSITD